MTDSLISTETVGFSDELTITIDSSVYAIRIINGHIAIPES